MNDAINLLSHSGVFPIRIADHKFAVASGPAARLASGLQLLGHQLRVEFVHVVYANVEECAGAFVGQFGFLLEFRLIFLIDLSEVDPEPIQVDLHQIRLALAKAEAQRFVELDGLLNFLT